MVQHGNWKNRKKLNMVIAGENPKKKKKGSSLLVLFSVEVQGGNWKKLKMVIAGENPKKEKSSFLFCIYCLISFFFFIIVVSVFIFSSKRICTRHSSLISYVNTHYRNPGREWNFKKISWFRFSIEEGMGKMLLLFFSDG